MATQDTTAKASSTQRPSKKKGVTKKTARSARGKAGSKTKASGKVSSSGSKKGTASRRSPVRLLSKPIRLPKSVVEIRSKPELDSEGNPALGVWVILRDSTPKKQRHPRVLSKIVDAIRSAAAKRDDIPPPSIRFRLKSEQDALDKSNS